VLSLLTIAILQVVPLQTQKAPSGPIRGLERLDGGVLVTLWLEHAPFPCEGHRYRDSTVLVWVPDHHRAGPSGEVDVLLHFHGHFSTANSALRATRIHQQLGESGRNAILVFPQLAVDARDSSAGRLEKPGGVRRLLYEVLMRLTASRVRRKLGVARLPRRPRLGRVVVSAHSGGFQGAAYVVHKPQIAVREVYLFDALYGYNHRFIRWLGADKTRRLVHVHRGTGKVARWTEKLRKSLRKRSIPIVSDEPEGTASRTALAGARVVISRTLAPHHEVPFATNALRDCLLGSPLGGQPSDFKSDTRSPRPVDEFRRR